MCLHEACGQHVSIYDLKRTLSGNQTQALMRASLDEHVNSNLDKLQFCISPGCSGLYMMSEARTASVQRVACASVLRARWRSMKLSLAASTSQPRLHLIASET
jgi:hypothetical protein